MVSENNRHPTEPPVVSPPFQLLQPDITTARLPCEVFPNDRRVGSWASFGPLLLYRDSTPVHPSPKTPNTSYPHPCPPELHPPGYWFYPRTFLDPTLFLPATATDKALYEEGFNKGFS